MEAFDLRASGQMLAKERHILEMQLAAGHIPTAEMEAELKRLRKEQAQGPIQWERNQEAAELLKSTQNDPSSNDKDADE